MSYWTLSRIGKPWRDTSSISIHMSLAIASYGVFARHRQQHPTNYYISGNGSSTQQDSLGRKVNFPERLKEVAEFQDSYVAEHLRETLKVLKRSEIRRKRTERAFVSGS